MDKICKTCHTSKPADAFEAKRKVCKDCRTQARKAAAEAKTDATPETATRPAACAECGTAFAPDKFQWRQDTKAWRLTCKDCLNDDHERRREALRAVDADAFKARNAAHQQAWRDRQRGQ